MSDYNATSYTDAPYDLPLSVLIPSKLSLPLYYADRPSILPGVSDMYLSLAAPIVVYWGYSLFFHLLDASGWADRYKLHEPEEVTKRNKVTPAQVIKAVLFQHAVQTAMGLVVLSEEPTYGVDHRRAMVPYASAILWLAQQTLGHRLAFKLLSVHGPEVVQFVYWWLVPALQFFWGSCVSLHSVRQYMTGRAASSSTPGSIFCTGACT
jgi:sphinganine C4-monooxygenase